MVIWNNSCKDLVTWKWSTITKALNVGQLWNRALGGNRKCGKDSEEWSLEYTVHVISNFAESLVLKEIEEILLETR